MSTKAGYDIPLMGLGDETSQPILLAFIDFFSWPIFIHTGVGIITWRNEDWLGVGGDIGTVRASRDSISTRAQKMELVLAPTPSNYVGEVLNEDTVGRMVEMYLAHWRDDDTALVYDPVLFFRGQMGPTRVELGSKSSLISVEVEDVRVMMGRINGLRATLFDHQELVVGDKFYDQLAAMVDHTFVFNGRDYSEAMATDTRRHAGRERDRSR